jgi:hypothetical protein
VDNVQGRDDFKKALKMKNFMIRNFNNIFMDKIINKLFYINNPSVSEKKQNSVAKIIINTVLQFSIVSNTWRWPNKAKTCCERGRGKKIIYIVLHWDGNSDIVWNIRVAHRMRLQPLPAKHFLLHYSLIPYHVCGRLLMVTVQGLPLIHSYPLPINAV